MKTRVNSGISKFGISLLAFGLLAGSSPLRSEESRATVSHGGFGIAINGFDAGTILVKACDLNRDGTVSLAELKQVAAACFKLWDLNKDGYLSAEELSSCLKQLFPAPPVGGMRAMAVVNGVQVE